MSQPERNSTSGNHEVTVADSTSVDTSCPSEWACDTAMADPIGNYFVAAYPPFSAWSAAEVPAAGVAIDQPSDSALDVPLGLYIHIPFCSTRCDYCYYLSYGRSSQEQRETYVDCLLAEWAACRKARHFAGRPLRFVYFGGGTPSLLGAKLTERLIRGLQAIAPWDRVQETTFECAPRSVNSELANVLRDASVNRISMGVQSWNTAVLAASRRCHAAEDALASYEILRRASFPIINLDLIAGLPGDTEVSFMDTVDRTISLRPESVTVYQLETPYYTPLSRQLREGDHSTALPSWETKRRWLGSAFNRLESNGYKIRSAYTAVLDLDRYAFIYQDLQYLGADLLGLGASAFSYCNGVHFQNHTSLDRYVAAVRRGDRPIERAHRLSLDERFIREFVLQLKLGRVDLMALCEKYSECDVSSFEPALRCFAKRGWLEWDDHEVRLTRDGLLRADSLLAIFYGPEHHNVPYI